MAKLTFNSYSQIQPRQVGDGGDSHDSDSKIGKAYEKRQGAAGKLRGRLASLGAKISGALGRKRVESSVRQVSEPMNAAAMKTAMRKISEQRVASYSVAKPAARPAAGSASSADKAAARSAASANADALALRDAITFGLSRALKTERGSALIDKTDIKHFSDSLSIALGLQDGALQLDQFAGLNAIKFEIEPFLPPDVLGKFDQLMVQTEKRLMES